MGNEKNELGGGNRGIDLSKKREVKKNKNECC
jgi:hypothetical protein